MIGLSSTTALMLYLCLTLGILLAVWISHFYRFRNKKVVIAEQDLLVCEYCHCAYLAKKAKTVTQCPQCHSYNKNNLYQENPPST